MYHLVTLSRTFPLQYALRCHLLGRSVEAAVYQLGAVRLHMARVLLVKTLSLLAVRTRTSAQADHVSTVASVWSLSRARSTRLLLMHVAWLACSVCFVKAVGCVQGLASRGHLWMHTRASARLDGVGRIVSWTMTSVRVVPVRTVAFAMNRILGRRVHLHLRWRSSCASGTRPLLTIRVQCLDLVCTCVVTVAFLT